MIEHARLLAEAIGWTAITLTIFLVAYATVRDLLYSKPARPVVDDRHGEPRGGTVARIDEYTARTATRPHPSDGNVIALGAARPTLLSTAGRDRTSTSSSVAPVLAVDGRATGDTTSEPVSPVLPRRGPSGWCA